MNESLAARQEALLRQNQELNQQVEAIEQRRQQLTAGTRPSSSLRKSSPDLEYSTNLGIQVSESIDSLSSQDINGSLVKTSTNKHKSSTKNHAKRSQRQKTPIDNESSQQESQRNVKSSEGSPTQEGDIHNSDPHGLGLEATIRYQKARLRVLQDEADTAMTKIEQLQAERGALKLEIEKLETKNQALTKKNQQTQQLLEKQRELSVAQDGKIRILEGQLESAQKRVEEIQREEKVASQQFRSKEVRLNRALEELEKVKAQLQDEKKNHGEQMVTKAEYDQVVLDNKKLDKQKGELLAAFKKQMKLIDLLKRQRIHMEAAKMLSFTEAEFSKTLELG